jgi:uncharacterized protein YndB with AHSA1/START domain
MDTENRHTKAAVTETTVRGMTSLLGPDEREVIFTRVIKAPRGLVFKAWTDAALLAHWWGPYGFTNHEIKVDARPGGSYRIVMRSPEGVDYPLKGVILDIDPPERLVMTADPEEHPAEWHALADSYRPKGADRGLLKMQWTANFEDAGGKTQLSILIKLASAADREAALKMGMADGWAQSLERLEALVSRGH